MNLRCMYCQNMFAVGREQMLIALQTMKDENLTYYEAHCPKCRRANRIERKKLELANPNWEETVKAMVKEAAKTEKAEKAAQEAKAPTKEKPAAEKKPAKPKPAAKKPAEKKPAKPKPATKKPAKAKKS